MPEQRPSPITQAAMASMAGARTPRLRQLGEALVRHLHAFVAEIEPTQAEWAEAIAFLTRTGQTCTPSRQEFILLSDVLGVSMLVDEINHRAAHAATSSTVVGPFYRPDPPVCPLGTDIGMGAPGTPMLVDCTVRAAGGQPLAGVTVDTWQADEEGFYDVQRADLQDSGATALRGRFHTGVDGRFWFWTVVPADYPIPADGPVGDLLTAFGRHPYRPAHVHFRLAHPDYRELITHVFLPGSPYLASDAVFGVKPDLIQAIDRHPPGAAPDGRLLEVEYMTLGYDFSLSPAAG
jgi:hydroxyquinol 1,2-dioxygenase